MFHDGGVWSVACSIDGRRIAASSDDGQVRIWDSETGALVIEPLESPDVWFVAISSDGQRVASGAYDGTLRAWDIETGAAAFKPTKAQPAILVSIAFTPDGRHVVSDTKMERC